MYTWSQWLDYYGVLKLCRDHISLVSWPISPRARGSGASHIHLVLGFCGGLWLTTRVRTRVRVFTETWTLAADWGITRSLADGAALTGDTVPTVTASAGLRQRCQVWADVRRGRGRVQQTVHKWRHIRALWFTPHCWNTVFLQTKHSL